MKELLEAYYSLLNGQITYGGLPVNVYLTDVPETETYHYIWIHPEGGNDDSNKHHFADNNVVVIDIVTGYFTNVDDSICEAIDSQIRAKIYTTPYQHNLSSAGKFFGQTVRQSYTYLRDDSNKYRKISRYLTKTV